MDQDGNECLFIDEYGCRCALGACMTDQEARQYNGLDLSSIPEFRDLSDNRKDLIRALVNCHDYANVKDWPDELRDIAAKSSLDCKFQSHRKSPLKDRGFLDSKDSPYYSKL